MSIHTTNKRMTIPLIRSMKGGEKIVSLTAATKWMSQMIDPVSDLTIVGDSLGMVSYGLESTLQVTLEMMILHGAAVVRGAKRACVVVDMPFGSYQESPRQAFQNASRIVRETGAQGVKIEGGKEMAETVGFLVDRGIPVMPHIGLMPQHVHAMGGFKAQGLTENAGKKLIEDAKVLCEAGGFSLLVEGTSETVARQITESVRIPTIGIGASPCCDGQVLVTEDLLGLFSDYTPKFVKQYADLGTQIKSALERFGKEVQEGEFPDLSRCFGVSSNKL
ncbi:3-methyl-2-oxobutanoate hydroxymethyltransferase [Marinobacter lacisalsi]|uniref:3-methyl-2-oxobutanoate hydroxymethyltransferase n=1 Tax=Marinobacter lacisalsi TaxID=475979 RepID=A0ABV8QEY3_9GAMM